MGKYSLFSPSAQYGVAAPFLRKTSRHTLFIKRAWAAATAWAFLLFTTRLTLEM